MEEEEGLESDSWCVSEHFPLRFDEKPTRGSTNGWVEMIVRGSIWWRIEATIQHSTELYDTKCPVRNRTGTETLKSVQVY